jgi:hypothetical protein
MSTPASLIFGCHTRKAQACQQPLGGGHLAHARHRLISVCCRKSPSINDID